MKLTYKEQLELQTLVKSKQLDDPSSALSHVEILRCIRNHRLSDSDWTQLADVNLANIEEWNTYRQALRDVTSQDGFPQNVVWPVKP